VLALVPDEPEIFILTSIRQKSFSPNMYTTDKPIDIQDITGQEIRCDHVGEFEDLQVMIIVYTFLWKMISEDIALEWDPYRDEFRVFTPDAGKVNILWFIDMRL